jgi:hypothetical protein
MTDAVKSDTSSITSTGSSKTMAVLTYIVEDEDHSPGMNIIVYSEDGDEEYSVNIEKALTECFHGRYPRIHEIMNIPGTMDFLLFTSRLRWSGLVQAYKYVHKEQRVVSYISAIRNMYPITDRHIMVSNAADNLELYDITTNVMSWFTFKSFDLNAYGNGVVMIRGTVYRVDSIKLHDLGPSSFRPKLENSLMLGQNRFLSFDEDSVELFDSKRRVTLFETTMDDASPNPVQVMRWGHQIHFCIVQGSRLDIYNSSGELERSMKIEGDARVAVLADSTFCVFNQEVYVHNLKELVWNRNIPGTHIHGCCRIH